MDRHADIYKTTTATVVHVQRGLTTDSPHESTLTNTSTDNSMCYSTHYTYSTHHVLSICTTLYQYALHIQYPPCVINMHYTYHVLCITHTVRNVLYRVHNVLSICTTHTVRNVLTYQYALHTTQYTLCVKHYTYSMPRVISATDLYGVLADSQSVP